MGNSFSPPADEPRGMLSVTSLAPVHTFYSSGAWIEGNATRQLASIASLPGVKAVAAMPDLHPGKFGPVGCAMLAEQVHPQFVGADIGCGMGLFQLDTPVRKLRADKTAERLRALEGPWDGDTVALLSEAGLGSTAFDGSLGTIGGGNHFCEVQAIEEIVEPEAAARAGLDRQLAYVLVHSGSRGLGYSVLERQFADGGAPLDPASEAGIAYLAAHDAAARWAVLNRRMIAARTADAVRADIRTIADVGHNLAERHAGGILHRKGAAPADRGLVAIPGSRGTLSYLVEPLAAARLETLASLAHGAGRKYDRSAMHGRVGTVKSELERLARNPFGGLVVCEDRNLLVEEAPDAYKAIDRVIADLVEFGLARVVATFRPLVTFKTARGAGPAKPARHSKRGGTAMTCLLLTSGRGPAECRIALGKVLAVMTKEAAAVGLDVDIAVGPAPDTHGPGSAVVVIEGDGADTFARNWTGSVLWVAQSPVRPHHKRKNWFVGVFRLPEHEVAKQTLDVADVRFETFCAGGPGGQHQNKTESAVRAVHIPTGLAVVARGERSQGRNKAAALRRLAELIRLGNEVATLAARQEQQANHDQLERGSPVRSFRGEKFEAVQLGKGPVTQ